MKLPNIKENNHRQIPEIISIIRNLPFSVKLTIAFIIWQHQHARLFSFPMTLSIRTGLIMFILLTIMPLHPMSLVIASGGGLSFALMMWRVK